MFCAHRIAIGSEEVVTGTILLHTKRDTILPMGEGLKTPLTSTHLYSYPSPSQFYKHTHTHTQFR